MQDAAEAEELDGEAVAVRQGEELDALTAGEAAERVPVERRESHVQKLLPSPDRSVWC